MRFYLKSLSSTLETLNRLVLASISMFLILSCSSFHQKVRNTDIGMTKKQVLRKLSEPQEKYRTKGLDHWVYESSKKAKNKSQGRLIYKNILIFNEGVLIDSKFERSFTKKELSEFYKQ